MIVVGWRSMHIDHMNEVNTMSKFESALSSECIVFIYREYACAQISKALNSNPSSWPQARSICIWMGPTPPTPPSVPGLPAYTCQGISSPLGVNVTIPIIPKLFDGIMSHAKEA